MGKIQPPKKKKKSHLYIHRTLIFISFPIKQNRPLIIGKNSREGNTIILDQFQPMAIKREVKNWRFQRVGHSFEAGLVRCWDLKDCQNETANASTATMSHARKQSLQFLVHWKNILVSVYSSIPFQIYS